MSLEGNFYMLQTNDDQYDDLRTASSIQADITKGKYVPPGGHVAILKKGVKENEEKKTVIFLGGTDHSQGKQYGFSSDLFSIEMESTNETFKLEKVKQVKSCGITTPSDQVRMEQCSAIFGAHGASMVDMKHEEDDEFDAYMWGGQDAELICTQNRLIEIIGDKEFKVETTKSGKETKISSIDVTAYPAKTWTLEDMPLPENFQPETETIKKKCSYR